MPDMKENWLPVPGYEGLYSVSNLGNVMSMNYNKTGLQKRMTLSPGSARSPYLHVHFRKDGESRTVTVHSLVMLAFVGPRPEDHDVNHKSGVKTDNRLTNLEYCTASENRIHAYEIGTHVPAHGEVHCRAKLKASDLPHIRKRAESGESQLSIAKSLGVDPSAISRIIGGKRWIRTTVSTVGG